MDDTTEPHDAATTLPLNGRVALVTGAAQGIGRAFAHALAAAGAHVAAADVKLDAAEETAAGLAGRRQRALAVEVDVSDERSVTDAVNRTKDELGRIDVLVNNAALFSALSMKPFEEITPDEWRRVIDVNLTGVFLMCRAVAPIMRDQGRGSIINLASGTVLSGRPNYLHYVTSKAGVVGMTRVLARELGTSGITVNSILPGSVDTGIPRASAPAGASAEILAHQSLKRRLTPDDITGTVVFLASDAARSMTGQSLVVDAGTCFV